MKKIKLSVKLSFKEYRKAYLEHLTSSKLIIVLLAAFVAILGITIYSFLSKSSMSGGRAITFFAVASAFIISLLSFFVIFFLRKLKKGYLSSPLLSAKLDYLIENEGITITTDDSEDTVKWANIFRVKEYKTNFAIYVTPDQALIIPKNHLKEISETTFKKIIDKNLEPEQLSLRP